MDIEEDEDQEEMVEAVLEKMWRYCQTYSIGNAGSVEDRQPHWYVMDEFGSRVPHSHMPTYRLVSLSLGTSNQPVCYDMIHRFVIGNNTNHFDEQDTKEERTKLLRSIFIGRRLL